MTEGGLLKRSTIRLGLFSPLMDLRFAVREPGRQRVLWKDWFETSRRGAWLRRALGPGDPARTVLVLSLSDLVYQLKLESMLCQGLMLKGWRPVILTSRSMPTALRYFRAAGIRTFAYWEDVPLLPEEDAAATRDAEEMLAREMSFKTVKEWTYQGVWIGPQLLSSIVRTGHLGSPDVNDPGVLAALRTNLPGILRLIYRARRMMDQVKPSMVLLNEANGEVYGPLTDLAVARGISAIQFTQPWKDDGLVVKRIRPHTRRIHPNSLERASLERLEAKGLAPAQEEELMDLLESRYSGKWFLQSRNQPNTRAFAKEEIVRQLGLDPAKKTVVVFSHILWDANLFYGDDLFEDYGDWFVRTVGAAIANPAVNWVIKLHPANVWKRARDQVKGELAEIALINRNFPSLPDHVKLLYPDAPISTLSLFRSIDCGVTVRGTVGIELPCFGVPLLTAGTGRFSGLGFTDDSATREEYLGRLARVQDLGPLEASRTRRARLHAYAIFKLRPWEMKSYRAAFNYQKTGTHPLDHNLVLEARDMEEVRRNGDLAAFADWAESDAVDYIASEHGPGAASAGRDGG